jgi:hypothetical protein
VLACLLLMPGLNVCADSVVTDVSRFAYPVQDAKDAFKREQYAFVGIQLHDVLETPGVTAREVEFWTSQPVEPLNTRWQSFANIEDDRSALLRLRQYANRYNLMMLTLLKEKRRSDIMRYRY